MKIEVEEKDLVYLLRAAIDDADFDQYEKGLRDSAKQTREKVKSVVSTINKQLGVEKYTYDFEYGLDEVKQENE